MAEKRNFFDKLKPGIDKIKPGLEKLAPRAEKLARDVNTDKYLTPAQAAARLRRDAILSAAPNIPSGHRAADFALRTAIERLDTDDEFTCRYDIAELTSGNVTLLGESFAVDWHTWQAEGANEPWLYALHSFGFVVPLAAEYVSSGDQRAYKAFRSYVRSWIAANPVGEGIGWHPATIARRMINICTASDLFSDVFSSDAELARQLSDSLYAQYCVLQQRCETWELGHRYFTELAAVTLGSLLFDEDAVYKKNIAVFLKEMIAQILPDGMHYELSPMYHKLVLEDLLRVAYWLKQCHKEELFEVVGHIQRMCDAISSLEYGMGKTPFFNDSCDGVAKDTLALLETAEKMFDIWPSLRKDILLHSGYCKLYDDDIALVFDAGRLSADNVTGHAHCDALSFELSKDGVPIFANSGVYKYDADMRAYFRATEAHNTAMVDDRQQTELREDGYAARRISATDMTLAEGFAYGTYKSYHGDVHSRTLQLRDRMLKVRDMFESKNGQVIKSFLHLAAGFSVEEFDGRVYVSYGGEEICEIRTFNSACRIRDKGKMAAYSPTHGVAKRAVTLDFRWNNDGGEHGYDIKFY